MAVRTDTLHRGCLVEASELFPTPSELQASISESTSETGTESALEMLPKAAQISQSYKSTSQRFRNCWNRFETVDNGPRVRMRAFVEAVSAAATGPVVLVSHGGPIIETCEALTGHSVPCGYTGLYCLEPSEKDGAHWDLKVAGDTSHLAEVPDAANHLAEA